MNLTSMTTSSQDAGDAVIGAALDQLATLMNGACTVALTGAGCSTESGIPDYRGPNSSARRRPPVQYQEFVRSEHARKRYWGRATLGWQRIRRARPNAGHTALAALESVGHINGIITQNVDGLHAAAGSTNVIELHGSLADVVCLDCDARVTRNDFQAALLAANPAWTRQLDFSAHEAAPDGDMEIPDEALSTFDVPRCTACDGIMKPDVVFFGENVPRSRVDRAFAILDDADVLLVAGSSLTVYSGRRFTYRAAERRIPIAVLNMGPTRADDLAAVKIEAGLGESLRRLAEQLIPTTHSGRGGSHAAGSVLQ